MKNIHDMSIKVREFNKFYEARLKYKDELQKALYVLSQYKEKRIKVEGKQNIKLLSKEFNEALNKEIKSIKNRLNKDIYKEKIKLFGEVLHYVWNHPDRLEKLIISHDLREFEVASGEYEELVVFTFSGELGDLLNSSSNFNERDDLVWVSFDKKIKFNVHQNYSEVKKVILSNFIRNDEEDYFASFLK